MNPPLQNQTALVTGGSRGIGRAVALRLARDGARVALTYHSKADEAESVVAAIARAGGAPALALQADVREVSQIRALFGQVKEHMGRPDILVNNAAGTNVFKPTAQMTEAEYDSMFLITRGVYFALQEACTQLADGGAIVSISTGGTSMAVPGGGAYAGSKAAVEQFSHALAKELGGRGIRVNTLAPGVTQTDGLSAPKEMLDMLIAQTPLGRLGTPEDIADAVAFLVGPDARWITGQSVRATGGIV